MYFILEVDGRLVGPVSLRVSHITTRKYLWRNEIIRPKENDTRKAIFMTHLGMGKGEILKIWRNSGNSTTQCRYDPRTYHMFKKDNIKYWIILVKTGKLPERKGSMLKKVVMFALPIDT